MSVLPRIALFLLYVLPRISQIYTEPSCCIFSHRLHRFTQNLLAVYSPTEFTEHTEPSCSMFSHGIHGTHRTFLLYVLPQIAQIFTDAAFRGCTCLKCTNPFVVALLALLLHFLLWQAAKPSGDKCTP